MKTEIESKHHSFGLTMFAGALLLASALAVSAQNLFVANWYGAIYEFTPGGTQSTFYSGGLGGPEGLAFDSKGDLFVADSVNGNVYEITPGGTRSVFASGVPAPFGLAFNRAGDLFVSSAGTSIGNGTVVEITPAGVKTTFATGLYDPNYLAFDGAGNLFVADDGSGNVIEITPGGAKSTFATGLGNATGLVFQPAPAPSIAFNAVVNAVSISTNRVGNLTYHRFGNRDLIRECASEMGLTNLIGLHLVYDLNNDALEVVSGYGTNRTLVCTPMTFSGGVFLSNATATKSERQAWVYWETNAIPGGTLTATERYGYGVSNQLVRFDLSGQLQFALPGNGTNAPTIYQGSLVAGSRPFVPVVPRIVSPPRSER